MNNAAPRISALGSVAIAVMHERGGFVFDRAYYFDPERRWEQDLEIASWCEEQFAPDPIYNAEAHLVQIEQLPCSFRQIGGLQPNLILGAALGAELVFPGNRDPDIDRPPLAEIRSIGDIAQLEHADWLTREPIATFLAQLDSFRTRYADQPVDIFPPFFWDRSGRATVHGPLTTAQRLLGERFFVLLRKQPEIANRVLEWISRAYLNLVREFSSRAGLPVTGIHIGECSGCMVSPKQWEEFVLPAVNILSDACGDVRMHSCGRSDHILPSMARVNDLVNLNIGSDTSVAKCRSLVGSDLTIDVIPDAGLLCNGDPEQVEQWVVSTIDVNAGGPMEIQVHVDAAVPFENVAAIFDVVRRHGGRCAMNSLVRRWSES